LLMGNTEHVHLDTSGQERDDWMHVHRDTRRRVQCDCGPDKVDVSLPDIVGLEEVARRVCAVDFESLGLTPVLRREPHVMEHRATIEQLTIELQSATQAGQRTKTIDPT